MSTYAEEQSARLKSEKESPFSPTHTYVPNGLDSIDPKGVRGEPIGAGRPVQLMKEHTKSLHTGMPPRAKTMFNVVRDETGNMQHVGKASLRNAQGRTEAIFHDRRGYRNERHLRDQEAGARHAQNEWPLD